mgnify:FL=1|jgi:hypothetical protein|tara:strand:+ start:265 stop:477 length:213 start_codon:yes stop_codon:yes gene_type:complete
MSILWLADKFKKKLAEKKEDTEAILLNGVESYDQYQYLRGRHNTLVDVENEFRELLEKIVENDDEESSSP